MAQMHISTDSRTNQNCIVRIHLQARPNFCPNARHIHAPSSCRLFDLSSATLRCNCNGSCSKRNDSKLSRYVNHDIVRWIDCDGASSHLGMLGNRSQRSARSASAFSLGIVVVLPLLLHDEGAFYVKSRPANEFVDDSTIVIIFEFEARQYHGSFPWNDAELYVDGFGRRRSRRSGSIIRRRRNASHHEPLHDSISGLASKRLDTSIGTPGPRTNCFVLAPIPPRRRRHDHRSLKTRLPRHGPHAIHRTRMDHRGAHVITPLRPRRRPLRLLRKTKRVDQIPFGRPALPHPRFHPLPLRLWRRRSHHFRRRFDLRIQSRQSLHQHRPREDRPVEEHGGRDANGAIGAEDQRGRRGECPAGAGGEGGRGMRRREEAKVGDGRSGGGAAGGAVGGEDGLATGIDGGTIGFVLGIYCVFHSPDQIFVVESKGCGHGSLGGGCLRRRFHLGTSAFFDVCPRNRTESHPAARGRDSPLLS
mmetsp:Transcript_21278/g.42421  ORF Transcript_21278/g.42421 Transcript_21278/m.42421 type:complete len:475 (+) Transcript_21278:996-2420(+)